MKRIRICDREGEVPGNPSGFQSSQRKKITIPSHKVRLKIWFFPWFLSITFNYYKLYTRNLTWYYYYIDCVFSLQNQIRKTKPVDNRAEEPMETSEQPQAQEYDVFGFMTPSGDSVKSGENSDKSEPGKVNGKGDHKAETEVKQSKCNGDQGEVEDIEMVDPDLTVAEELSQAQKQSPKKEDASNLKNFVLSGHDSDASRDVAE